MSIAIFVQLLSNSILLFTATFVYGASNILPTQDKPLRKVFLGMILGGFSLLIMYNAVSFEPGIFYDTRSVLMSVVAGFFPGLTSVTTTIIATIYRIVRGGSGVYAGVLTFLSAAAPTKLMEVAPYYIQTGMGATFPGALSKMLLQPQSLSVDRPALSAWLCQHIDDDGFATRVARRHPMGDNRHNYPAGHVDLSGRHRIRRCFDPSSNRPIEIPRKHSPNPLSLASVARQSGKHLHLRPRYQILLLILQPLPRNDDAQLRQRPNRRRHESARSNRGSRRPGGDESLLRPRASW